MLAIETSQREGSVALRDRAGQLHIEPLRAGRRHDDDLLPAVDRLVRQLHLSPRDLQAVAVCVGPGGFTGLRIAVSTAMMLGEALTIPIIAVPGAMVAAQCTLRDRPSPAAILIALASKGDSFWATRLLKRRVGDEWSIVGEPHLVQADDVDLAGIDMVLADEHFPIAARARCEASGVAIEQPLFDAGGCLQVGEQFLARGESTDPLRLSPLYPRQPEAVTLWQQRKTGSSVQ